MSKKIVTSYIDEKGRKQGTFLEGERNPVKHKHDDGSFGNDVEAYRHTYKDGKRVYREKAPEWGKIHE